MKPSQITIRPACVADAHAIAALLRNVFTWAYGRAIPDSQLAAFLAEAFAEQVIVQDIRQPEVIFHVAELAGELVGVARLEPTISPHDTTLPLAIELTKCYILPEYHGQGIADRLLHEMVSLTRNAGWQQIWLCVWQENPRAVAFYQKHGFVIIGTTDVWVGDIRFNDYVMVRGLYGGLYDR